jgi:hypothetical protein
MLNVTEGEKSLLRFAGRTFVDRTDVVGQGLREKPAVKAGTLVFVLAAKWAEESSLQAALRTDCATRRASSSRL